MNPPLSLQGATLDQLRQTAHETQDKSMLEALRVELTNRRLAINAAAGAMEKSAEKLAELQAVIDLEGQVEAKLNAPTGTPATPAPAPRLSGTAGRVQGFFEGFTKNPAVQGVWKTIGTIGEWAKGTAVWFGEMWKTTIGPTLTYMKNGIKTWLNSMGSGFVTGASSVLGFFGFNKAAEVLQRFATGEALAAQNPEAQQLRDKIQDRIKDKGITITQVTSNDVRDFKVAHENMRTIQVRIRGIKDKAILSESEYPDTIYITAIKNSGILLQKYPGKTQLTAAEFVRAAEEFNQKEEARAHPIQPAGTSGGTAGAGTGASEKTP